MQSLPLLNFCVFNNPLVFNTKETISANNFTIHPFILLYFYVGTHMV